MSVTNWDELDGTDYIDAFDSTQGRLGRICCENCTGDRFVGPLELSP